MKTKRLIWGDHSLNFTEFQSKQTTPTKTTLVHPPSNTHLLPLDIKAIVISRVLSNLLTCEIFHWMLKKKIPNKPD